MLRRHANRWVGWRAVRLATTATTAATRTWNAYRDWVAMNEMAKREMTQSQESSQPAILLKKIDRPVGEQLEMPVYLQPGESTATTLFYRQDHGAVELEGEDYQVYMNSKRKWEKDQQMRACSMCGEKRDLGVALEVYACLLE